MALSKLHVTLKVHRPTRHYSGCGANLFMNPSYIGYKNFTYSDSNIQKVGISTLMGNNVATPSVYNTLQYSDLNNGSKFDIKTGDYTNDNSSKPGLVLYVLYHSDAITIYNKGTLTTDNLPLLTYQPNIDFAYFTGSENLSSLGLRVIEHNEIDDEAERENVIPNIEYIIKNSKNTLNAYKRFVIVFTTWEDAGSENVPATCGMYINVRFRKIGTGNEYRYLLPPGGLEDLYEESLGVTGRFQYSIVDDLCNKYLNIRSFNFKLQPYILINGETSLDPIYDDNFFVSCDNKYFKSSDVLNWMYETYDDISNNLEKTVNYEISTTSLYDLLPNNDNSYYPKLSLNAPKSYTDKSGNTYNFLGWCVRTVVAGYSNPYELDALLYISSSSTCDFGINDSFFNNLINMPYISVPPFYKPFSDRTKFPVDTPLFDGTSYIHNGYTGMETYGTIELAAIYTNGGGSNKKIRIIKAY